VPSTPPCSPVVLTKEEKKQAEYDALLSEANNSSLEDLRAFNFLDIAGTDLQGRKIILFIASKIPAKIASHDRILLFLIKMLDPIVVEDYVLVYVHANFRSENQPPYAWIKKVYGLLGRKYVVQGYGPDHKKYGRIIFVYFFKPYPLPPLLFLCSLFIFW
jgi:hypothetical protein